MKAFTTSKNPPDIPNEPWRIRKSLYDKWIGIWLIKFRVYPQHLVIMLNSSRKPRYMISVLLLQLWSILLLKANELYFKHDEEV